MPGMPWPLPWPFDRTYMQLALIAAVVVGACAPLIGTFLVQKRLALMGDGIGHVAVAGIGAGLLFGTSPLWTALVFGVVAALAIEWLRSRGRASGDLALALFFYGGIAAGVVFASRAHAPNLQPYLFGSILTVSSRDVLTVVAMGAVIVIATVFTRRALLAVVLDDEAARVAGLPADGLNAMLAALTAVTVVSAMRIVGVLLVAALMVLPVATSRLVARSFKATMLGAVGVGVVSAVVGLAASRQWALAAGGAIVLVAAGLFAAAAVFGSVARIRERLGAESLLAGPH